MAAQGIFQEHWVDEDGNPAGGVSTGKGRGVRFVTEMGDPLQAARDKRD